jgi:type IV secretion system protein VirD4
MRRRCRPPRDRCRRDHQDRPFSVHRIDAPLRLISREREECREFRHQKALFQPRKSCDDRRTPALPPGRKTLRTLRAAVAALESKLRRILDGIYENSHSPLARDLAGTLKEVTDRTFSGIAVTAAGRTDWLATTAFADLVSGNSFKTLDVVNGKKDIFVCLPLKALQSTPGVGRCIIGALLNAAYEANGAVNGRILFLLDEAFRLGRMDIIEIARDAGRKYGITLQLLYQSVGQIVEQWGEAGKRAWYESASWRGYAAVKDPETAEELSETIGN